MGMGGDPSAAMASMSTAAPAAGAGMEMAGGWQMPGVTGGTSSLYGAPGATGAMDPGAPSRWDWFQDPKHQQALLGFGQQLLQHQQQRQAPQAVPMSPGHYQPPQQPAAPGYPTSNGMMPANPFWGGSRF